MFNYHDLNFTMLWNKLTENEEMGSIYIQI